MSGDEKNRMAEGEKYPATYNEAYNRYREEWRSGTDNLSSLAGDEKKPVLAVFDDPIVEEVIDSLRREVAMLERRLAKVEEHE